MKRRLRVLDLRARGGGLDENERGLVSLGYLAGGAAMLFVFGVLLIEIFEAGGEVTVANTPGNEWTADLPPAARILVNVVLPAAIVGPPALHVAVAVRSRFRRRRAWDSEDSSRGGGDQ